MSETIIHIAEDGRIINKIAVRSAFDNLRPGDTLMVLTPANKRSLSQNRYYHGVVIPLILAGLRDVGYNEVKTAESVHDVLKYKFLRQVIPCENDGPGLETIRSTSKLTTVEFMEYIAEIQQWAAEFLNIDIPDPGTQSSFKFFSNEG